MKILIIGQAPPLKAQEYPYDTTLLYEMLSWAGITKEKAQELFEFEAVASTFPGKTKSGGHKTPTKTDVNLHFLAFLREKLEKHPKVILLGRTAEKYVIKFLLEGAYKVPKNAHYVNLVHPSRRNYKKIMDSKEDITELLTKFVK